MGKSIREQERESAKDARPPSIKPKKKRLSPGKRKPNAIRRDSARQAEKYGKPTAFRLSPEMRAALTDLATKYQVTTKEMAVYLMALSMNGIVEHNVKVPVRWDSKEQRNVIDTPAIPEIK